MYLLCNYKYINKLTKPISENAKYVRKVRTQTLRLYFLIAVIVIQDFETWFHRYSMSPTLRLVFLSSLVHVNKSRAILNISKLNSPVKDNLYYEF